jgi:hypothetical protein
MNDLINMIRLPSSPCIGRPRRWARKNLFYDKVPDQSPRAQLAGSGRAAVNHAPDIEM